MKKLIKLFSIATMAAAGAFSLVNISNRFNKKVENVAADGTMKTTNKVLISLKNGGWVDAGVLTAVYFWNDSTSTSAFSSKYVTEYPLFDSGNSIYIVDVPNGTWEGYKCVRVNPQSCPSTPNSTCWNQGINWGETSNHTFGSKNTLEPVIGGGYDYDTAWKFEAGTQLYFDLNGKNWTTDSHVIGIHLWGNTAGGADTDLLMHNVNGFDGGDNANLYEITIPGSGYWSNVLFFRAPSSNPSSYSNQTGDLSGNASNNVYKLSDYDWDYTGGWWAWNQSDEGRAEIFGFYFMDQISCTGSGSIDESSVGNWDNVSDEFDYLSSSIQSIIRASNGSESGATYLLKAMYRYDYIVFHKAYGYDDFILRASSSGKSFSGSSVNGLLFSNKSSNSVIIISLISVASISAIGGYFFYKKRRENI